MAGSYNITNTTDDWVAVGSSDHPEKSVTVPPNGTVNISEDIWNNLSPTEQSSFVVNSTVGALSELTVGTVDIGVVDQGNAGISLWKVDGSGVTQPVSAASLPLPTGASTSTLQGTANTKLDTLHTDITSTNTKLDTIHSDLTAGAATDVTDRAGRLLGHVTVDSSALPTGASTSALQSTANTKLDTIHSDLTTIEGDLDIINANILNLTKPSDVQLTNGSLFTQPVSATSLPLPTGAATEATLAGIKTGTDKIPASPAQDRTTAGAPNSTRLSDGSAFYKATTPSDTQPVSAASLPLPSGAATSAKQPALGTAGTPSTDVITVQGITSGTPQPVSFVDTATTGANITAADVGTVSTGGQDGSNIISGTPTANSFQTIASTGSGAVTIVVSGTWTGTLQFETSADVGSTYVASPFHVQGSVYARSAVTSNGQFEGSLSANDHLRVRATAWTSGTATIKFLQGVSVHVVKIGAPIRIYDNTSGASVSIKAASTAASVTDTSMVVQEASPNTPRNGQKTVTTSGTRVQVATSPTSVKAVTIQGLSTNTGSIWVGDSTVTTTNGFECQPGQSVTLAISDLNLMYVDATTNGDKFAWLGS